MKYFVLLITCSLTGMVAAVQVGSPESCQGKKVGDACSIKGGSSMSQVLVGGTCQKYRATSDVMPILTCVNDEESIEPYVRNPWGSQRIINE